MSHLKTLMLLLPLSFSLISATSPNTETENIARGGGGGGRGGDFGGGRGDFGGGRGDFDRNDRNANFDNYRGYERDANAGYYYGGYGGYGNGYGGYGNGYTPQGTINSDADVDQTYQNNLNNMERTGH